MADCPSSLPAKPQHSTRKTFRYLAAAVVMAALAFLAWAYLIGELALPQLDGNVGVNGVAAPVTVSRDGQGVPTITAASLDDLFFAQGYVTAQDRLWQMDGMRRFAAGDLAEILGPDYVGHDREQRILGMRVAARKALEVASPLVREHYAAYAQGINAWIQSRRNHLPLEFCILGYALKPWTPEDSALIAAQMVKDLSASPRHALIREKILAKLGPELTANLYVNWSRHDRPPTVMRKDLIPAAKDKDRDEDEDDNFGSDNSMAASRPMVPLRGQPIEYLAKLELGYFSQHENDTGIGPPVVGSNNWVISGAHTVSGKPLLSNDMHLGHQMPNLWYEAHLRCGDFDVAGVTLPGVPYVIVGHNRRIAWGFTNIGPTVEDAYIETFNGAGRYLTATGWKDAEHRREIIRVKGSAEVTMDVVMTRHGPIVSALVPGETRQVALRWTLYDGIRNPFFEVNSAQNWEQFRQAFSGFDAPAQNVVYADVDGNIGYQATGKIPIRASGDGSLPENGSDDAHEWTGYIPFDKLPSVLNPQSGVLATANSRITPDKYPYSISTGWEAPWRAARVYRVLESGRKFQAADMLALENDIGSEFEHFAAEQFVYAVDNARAPSGRAKQAAEILRQWDGRMTADSAAPTWKLELGRNLCNCFCSRNSASRERAVMLARSAGKAIAGACNRCGWRTSCWAIPRAGCRQLTRTIANCWQRPLRRR